MNDAAPETSACEPEFIPERNQDAYFTIRGFVHQVDVTIRSWLDLDEHALLELERGEDIDTITAMPSDELQDALLHKGATWERLLEQVKHLEKNVTLRTPEIVQAICNFAAHRKAGEQGEWLLRFRFTTTGKAGHERPAVLNGIAPADAEVLRREGVKLTSPGIALWGRVGLNTLRAEAQGVVGRQLRLLFHGSEKPVNIEKERWEAFQHLLAEGQEAAFFDLVRHFEFSTADEAGASLRQSLEQSLERNELAGNASQAEQLYEHLFSYVFRLLSTPGTKRLTRADLLTEARRPSTADSGLVRAFEHYLNEEVGERLDELQLRWREARYAEVGAELERLSHPARQALLDSTRKAQVLSMACRLELQLSRDIDRAAHLAGQVEALGEDATLLRGYLASAQGDPARALALMAARTDREAEHFRAGVQIELGEVDVVAPLEALVQAGGANGETHRLLALALMARGDLMEARRHVEAALSAPEADEGARLAGAIVAFQETLSPVAWGGLQWPPSPHEAVLIRRDDESVARLLQAATVFERAAAAAVGAPERAQHMQYGRLACLANRLDDLGPAADLAASLLTTYPEDAYVLFWVYARDLSVDLSSSREALDTRLLGGSAEPRDVQALVFIHLASGETATAQALLEKHAALLATHQAPESRSLEPGLMPEAERGLLRALIISPQNAREAVLAFQALALVGEWDVVAPQARWLVSCTQTFGGLQLGATAAFNAQDFEGCRELLEGNIQLCPGGRLSPHLQRLLVESLARTGDLPGAVRGAEELLREQTDEDPVLLYTRLLMAMGDDARLEVAARAHLRSEHVVPELLLVLADEVFNSAPELARKLWSRGDEAGFPDRLVGEAVRTATEIGLVDEGSRLLNRAWLLGPEKSGILMGSFEGTEGPPGNSSGGATEEDLRVFIRRQQETAHAVQSAYERGEIPVHEACRGNALAAVICELLQSRPPGAQKLNLPGRHGSRGLPHDDGVMTRLTLDVTAFMTAAHLELLPVLEAAFGPLRVTPFLMLALTQAVHARRPQLDRAVHQVVLDTVGASRLRALPETAPRAPGLVFLGDHWDVLHPFSQQENVRVVDDLVARMHSSPQAPEISGELNAVHPEKILDALEAEGLLEEDQVSQAREALWSAHGQVSPEVIPGETLAVTATALHALARAGIFKVAARHFDLVVAPDVIQGAERWAEQERQRNETCSFLERQRRHLRAGLDEGRYVLLPHPARWAQLPVDAALNDLTMIRASPYRPHDAVWVEDRHVSAQQRIGEGQLWTLTDILEALWRRGHLDDRRHGLLLQRQRQAGIGLTPTLKGELWNMLRLAPVKGGVMTPTAGLRAWANHVEAMRNFAPALQLDELALVGDLVGTVVHTLKQLWCQVDEATAPRALWLIKNAPLTMSAALSIRMPDLDPPEVEALEAAAAARLLPLIPPGAGRTAFAAWWKELFLDRNEEFVLATLADHFVNELGRHHPASSPAVRQRWLQERVQDLPEEVRTALLLEPRLRRLTTESQ